MKKRHAKKKVNTLLMVHMGGDVLPMVKKYFTTRELKYNIGKKTRNFWAFSEYLHSFEGDLWRKYDEVPILTSSGVEFLKKLNCWRDKHQKLYNSKILTKVMAMTKE